MRAPITDEELEQWAKVRADDAGHLARELITYRRVAAAALAAQEQVPVEVAINREIIARFLAEKASTIDEAARLIASWINLSWDGLPDQDISDEYPDWAYNGFGTKVMQGGKPALRKLAEKILALGIPALPPRTGVDLDRLPVGMPVEKIGGYPFPGVIRAAFTTTEGNERFVVEATGADYRGMLHIFNGGQLRAATGEHQA